MCIQVFLSIDVRSCCFLCVCTNMRKSHAEWAHGEKRRLIHKFNLTCAIFVPPPQCYQSIHQQTISFTKLRPRLNKQAPTVVVVVVVYKWLGASAGYRVPKKERNSIRASNSVNAVIILRRRWMAKNKKKRRSTTCKNVQTGWWRQARLAGNWPDRPARHQNQIHSLG